jgi:hypothetical protein
MSNDLALPAITNQPLSSETPILMDELIGMSFDEARHVVENNRSGMVIASRNLRLIFGGKTGLNTYFDMLRETDPNAESSETSEKALSTLSVYSHGTTICNLNFIMAQINAHLQNKT